jgi:hypothetical protein
MPRWAGWGRPRPAPPPCADGAAAAGATWLLGVQAGQTGSRVLLLLHVQEVPGGRVLARSWLADERPAVLARQLGRALAGLLPRAAAASGEPFTERSDRLLEALRPLVTDEELPLDSRLGSMDVFLGEEPATSRTADAARTLRDEVLLGPQTSSKTWLSLAMTYPPGLRLGLLRVRWRWLQLQAAQASIGIRGGALGLPVAVGLLGGGVKLDFGPGGFFELGGLLFPLAYGSYEVRDHSDRLAAEGWELGMLDLYLRLDGRRWHLALGLQAPLLWSSTSDHSSWGLEYRSPEEGSVYRGWPPVLVYLGGGL